MIFGIPITENDTVSLMFGIDSNQITTYQGLHAAVDHQLHRRDGHPYLPCLAFGARLGARYPQRLLMPTRGMYQRVGLEVTLPGSTVEYYKLNYQISRYWPIIPSLVINTRLELGYGDSYGNDTTRDICGTYDTATAPGYVIYVPQDCNGTNLQRRVTATGLPFYENFYAGGTNSVRGFEDNTLGPRSEATSAYPKGQPLGGSVKTVGSIEAYFPKLFDSPSARLSRLRRLRQRVQRHR